MSRALLLDAAEQNGWTPLLFSVSAWWLLELVAGLQKRLEVCECTGMVSNHFEESGAEGQHFVLSSRFKILGLHCTDHLPEIKTSQKHVAALHDLPFC